jgi:hypothetical protein
MFQNLFGSVSRFIQRHLAPQQPRATTPQGQAKLDAAAQQRAMQQQKGAQQPMGWTPEGQAKLDANNQAKQATSPYGKPMESSSPYAKPMAAPPPFAKPMGEGKGLPHK